MGLTDFVKGLFSKSEIQATSQLEYSAQDGGLLLSLPNDIYKEAVHGRGSELSLHQFLRMQMLLEEGIAVERIEGIWLAADDAVALDADTRYVFDLPPVWAGKFKLQVTGTSRQSDFALQLHLITPDGETLRQFQLNDPLLQLSAKEIFLPDSAQYQALSAVVKHSALAREDRTEFANLNAVQQVIQAADAGLDIDRAAFKDFQTVQADSVGLAVEVLPDGSLELQPSFGEGLDQAEVAKRLGQIEPGGGGQSLRIGKTILLLDEPRLQAAHEIIRKRHIPAAQRRKFFAAPASFLDASLINLDAGFSLRVKGAGPFQHAYFGEVGSNEIDWFAQGGGSDPVEALLGDPEATEDVRLFEAEDLDKVIKDLDMLAEFKQKLDDAAQSNATVLRFDEQRINITDRAKVQAKVAELEERLQMPDEDDTGPLAIDIHLNDTEADYGAEIQPPDKGIVFDSEIDFAAYTRSPFPHQVAGVRWMLALATNQGRPLGEEHRIEGALLADDMGLGKTYMSIVGIREILLHTDSNKPVLVVAPLSLLENWKREVQDTYKEPLFKRIIILQADGDLPKYRIQGMGVETKAKPRSVEPQFDTNAAGVASEADSGSANLQIGASAAGDSVSSKKVAAGEVLPWEDAPDDIPMQAHGNEENAEETPANTASAEQIAAGDSVSNLGSTLSEKPEEPEEPEESEAFFPEYSLKLGAEWGMERLDLPNTLVLTTYQTLRDYQFSLASIPWSVVVFDEAQNIKSPNTLQTRAAKALNAEFKLMVTGTPVENHLGEFWCLFDTVQPGFLGSYQEFRQNYIKPILKAPPDEVQTIREEIGQQLRDRVGGFMLRRIKEDHLKNLPVKRIILGDYNAHGDWVFDARIQQEMQGKQRLRYEDVMGQTLDDLDKERSPGTALLGLQHLRDVSLHPTLLEGLPSLPITPEAARQFFMESGKMQILLRILDGVQEREEKVLVFAVNKRLQELLAMGIGKIYGLQVPIINGATKAVSKNPNNPTRQVLIDRFQAKDGFGVMVISPVAAGVGLTITAANNVIHLERHWNPAKEAQATDRAYRIGQTKDVNVYIPILTHPDFDSFDVNLNRLLSSKTSLKDAIITQEEVQMEDFVKSGMFDKAK